VLLPISKSTALCLLIKQAGGFVQTVQLHVHMRQDGYCIPCPWVVFAQNAALTRQNALK
jgi:hypothetical protein